MTREDLTWTTLFGGILVALFAFLFVFGILTFGE